MVSPLGKRDPKVNIQLSRTARHHFGLPSLGSVGESVGLNNQGSDRNRYEGRAYSNWSSDLGRHSSFCQPEQRYKSVSLSLCRTKLMALSGHGVAMAIWAPSKWTILAMGPVLLAGGESGNPSSCGSRFLVRTQGKISVLSIMRKFINNRNNKERKNRSHGVRHY